MTFKVGDRVVAYLAGTLEQQPFREVGRVVAIQPDKLRICVDEGKTEEAAWWVHKKQCRKLVKRERRRWTLFGDTKTAIGGIKTGPLIPLGQTVDVVEVKRRKGEKEKL